MIGWSFANAHNWMPEPPIDPPMTDWDRYQNQYDQWLSDNYDKETDTVLGVPNDEAWEDEALFDKFMDEVINAYYD